MVRSTSFSTKGGCNTTQSRHIILKDVGRSKDAPADRLDSAHSQMNSVAILFLRLPAPFPLCFSVSPLLLSQHAFIPPFLWRHTDRSFLISQLALPPFLDHCFGFCGSPLPSCLSGAFCHTSCPHSLAPSSLPSPLRYLPSYSLGITASFHRVNTPDSAHAVPPVSSTQISESPPGSSASLPAIWLFATVRRFPFTIGPQSCLHLTLPEFGSCFPGLTYAKRSRLLYQRSYLPPCDRTFPDI